MGAHRQEDCDLLYDWVLMTVKTVIEARGVSIGYPGRLLMEKISFAMNWGEVFIILGGSGCGKNTLLKTLIGLLPAMEGEVLILGKDLARASGEDRIHILSRLRV
ncbi:MAG: ATP-binding cassette domain-containing protein [Chthoniobacterales bacterium]